MTDHEEHQEIAPASATDPRSDAELDAIAEAEVEGLPVATDAALRTTPRAGGRFQGAIDAVLPRGRFGDQRDILGGAGQNVIGLAAGVLTTFATQVIMTRGPGPRAVRRRDPHHAVRVHRQHRHAVRHGRGERPSRGDPGRSRRVRADAPARADEPRSSRASSRSLVGVAVILLADRLSTAFVSPRLHRPRRRGVRCGGVAIPFAALTWVYLGATRGLKIMRHTLYIFWIGQPLGWIVDRRSWAGSSPRPPG